MDFITGVYAKYKKKQAVFGRKLLGLRPNLLTINIDYTTILSEMKGEMGVSMH